MPRPHPPEFRQRAVELARERAKPVAQIAKDLAISESCLRRWMELADVDAGRKEGMTRRSALSSSSCAESFVWPSWRTRSEAGRRLLRPGERPPKMTYTFIARRCADLPVAACCRVMGVSTSAFYAWQANPVSKRDWDDAVLTNVIVDIHQMSRRSYGSPRVHAEMVLGEGFRCSRKRVERLMRQAGVAGIHRRKLRGCTRRDLDATPSADLVNRQFAATEPDRLWVMDVTEHLTDQGKVYLATVLDAFSRRVVGWSIADHIRSELVVDAVQMAIWRRNPPPGQTIAHSDHG